MIACICLHSNAFYVILHFCVHCVYWWWTSSTRWSPYKARSRSELKLNLMMVIMLFALSNHLFWHSFNCNVLFCMLSLIPFVLVLCTRWYDDTKACSTSWDLWIVDWRTGLLIVTCMIYAFFGIYICLVVCNV